MYGDMISYVIDVLSRDEYSTEELYNVIGRIITELAPKLHIGYVTFFITTPKNIYSRERKKLSYVILKKDNFNEDGIIHLGSTLADNTSYGIDVYPENEFTRNEINFLEKLAFIFSTVVGKERRQEIINNAENIDQLTGYLNSNGIHNFIAMLYSKGTLKDYVTIFFNINNCRDINNKCGGISEGNILIRKFADKINDCLDIEENIARHGGDNFSIIVKKEKLPQILDLLTETEVSAIINGNRVSYVITCNVGYYINKENDAMFACMDNASTAMGMSKKMNSSHILEYDDRLAEKIDTARRIKESFADAIEDGRIIPFYQPKINSKDDSLYGAEALCRWVKTDGSFLSPGLFIPVLEEASLVCDIDFCILDKVCNDIRSLLDSGFEPVPISVNFSKFHFIKDDMDKNFVNRIINTINKCGIDPKYIEVEFTESGRVEDYKLLSEIVHELHKAGIKVSVDDYGTGYSSLQLIEEVSFDTIKMDKSFADSIGTTIGNIIFESTTDMMKKLGKEIICEGVETQEQIDFLRSIDCNIIQGYYYDRPMPYERFVLKLSDNKGQVKKLV